MTIRHRARLAAQLVVRLSGRRRLLDYVRGGVAPHDIGESTRLLVEWTRAVFAAGGGAAASAGYDLRRGWLGPYPEITGYFIPTLLLAARERHDPSLRDLAIRAGRWLGETRLPSGAICRKQWFPGNETPSVFNTGQVLDGWCALYAETTDGEWKRLAIDAADWLVAEQESDGSWVKSAFNGIAHTYYARVGWPMVRCGQLLQRPGYVEAGRRHLDWVVSKQDGDGWFNEVGFETDAVPTTHGIAYVIEGLLEGGLLLGEAQYVESAERGARGLLAAYRGAGFLPGAIGRGWRFTAKWRCLTGDAQTALVWARLGRTLGDRGLTSAAESLLRETLGTQQIRGNWPEVSGAIPGSSPPWGDYDPFGYPAHAAKFALDAIFALGLGGARSV